MSVTVRAATHDDLDALAARGAALARLHAGWDAQRFTPASTDDVEVGYRWWFSQEIKKKNVCFRVVDGDDAGLAGYVYGRKEGRDYNRLLDPHADLIDLFVQPSHRRHGVGKALVLAFCDWAREKKAGPVVLTTATKNTEAQALFASLGFRPTMLEMTRDG
jgi:ribosomal protein S18 acetylase RimI-like enzyme